MRFPFPFFGQRESCSLYLQGKFENSSEQLGDIDIPLGIYAHVMRANGSRFLQRLAIEDMQDLLSETVTTGTVAGVAENAGFVGEIFAQERFLQILAIDIEHLDTAFLEGPSQS
jgi:hypothetical protein